MKKKTQAGLILVVATLIAGTLIQTQMANVFAATPAPSMKDIGDMLTDIVGKLWSNADSVKNDTIAINSKLENVTQIVTGSHTKHFDAGTEAGTYMLAQVGLTATPKAADLQVAVSTLSEDFTPSPQDYIFVQAYTGFNPGIGVNIIDVRDEDVYGVHTTQFAGTQFVIWVHFAAALTSDVNVGYSYTVTAEPGSTVVENLP